MTVLQAQGWGWLAKGPSAAGRRTVMGGLGDSRPTACGLGRDGQTERERERERDGRGHICIYICICTEK